MRFLTGLMLTAVAAAPVSAAPKSVEIRPYGTTKAGQPVSEYVLRNARGAEVHVISYGGIITQIDVPDRRGRKANVALGFGSLAEPGPWYVMSPPRPASTISIPLAWSASAVANTCARPPSPRTPSVKTCGCSTRAARPAGRNTRCSSWCGC